MDIRQQACPLVECIIDPAHDIVVSRISAPANEDRPPNTRLIECMEALQPQFAGRGNSLVRSVLKTETVQGSPGRICARRESVNLGNLGLGISSLRALCIHFLTARSDVLLLLPEKKGVNGAESTPNAYAGA